MEEGSPHAPLLAAAAAQDAGNDDDNDDDDAGSSVCIDWLGRPAADRPNLGGWICSSCVIGAYAFANLAYYGILANLVLYLIQVWGETNAAAAKTLTNISGTLSFCCSVGALLSDAYVPRLWASLTFQTLNLLFNILVSLAVALISKDSATAAARSFFLVSLYLMVMAGGPSLATVMALGVDQLSSTKEREMYFRLLIVSSSIGQLLAVTVVTYIDNEGMWVWGFLLGTAATVANVALVAGVLRWFRQYKVAGNPLLRIIQVIVAALRKHALSLPTDSSLLYERQGKLSAIPGCCKLQHTNSLRFLDKAAVMGSAEISSHWHLCTVTQVEELKIFLRILPVGIAVTLVFAINAQIGSLFEEQATMMNRQVTTWLVIPPASLNLFSLVSSILVGIMSPGVGGRLLGWCIGCGRSRRSRKAYSLQMQGVALMCSIIAMVTAALVESHRLYVAKEGGLLSILWLVPQTALIGASMNLAAANCLEFFYNELSDGMRSAGSSLYFIFTAVGNYLSSIFVAIVTAITTQGGQPGWIASNLNEGHVDYFYWLLASCSTVTLGFYLVYTHFYKYTSNAHMDDI